VPGPGPVVAEHRPQLVGGGGAGADLVLAEPDQGLQLAQAGVGGFEPAQPVPVGAQVIGELVAVAGIGLRAGCSPPGPCGEERGRVHRDDRVPGGEQPVDDQAAGLLDDHRQVTGVAVAAQPCQRHLPAGLAMGKRPPVQHGTSVIQHRDIVSLAGPVPADIFHSWPPSRGRWQLRGLETLSRFLIVRPSVGHVPQRRSPGLGARSGSTKTGRHDGSATRPSPGTTEEPRPGHPDRETDSPPMRQRRISRSVLCLARRAR
jgi:hypothetical protein